MGGELSRRPDPKGIANKSLDGPDLGQQPGPGHQSHRTSAAEIRNPEGGILLRLEAFSLSAQSASPSRPEPRSDARPSSDRFEIPTHPHLCAVHTCTASPASLTGQRLSLFTPRLVPSYIHDSHHSMHLEKGLI